ncbi:uncharacterized protein LOC132504848 [Lagenorhynchus albirostris]|uniref:uncharacterized protein LOC132504848 n=1 Tax=Lagenorhynchus albirostris TaxID=27610 RepID=UPI0028EF95C0|nr:uncharacterized protein LOC132504848 [Lagenorhynchus albirostris]
MSTETAWQVETGETCQECVVQGGGSRCGSLDPWLEGAGRRLQMSDEQAKRLPNPVGKQVLSWGKGDPVEFLNLHWLQAPKSGPCVPPGLDCPGDLEPGGLLPGPELPPLPMTVKADDPSGLKFHSQPSLTQSFPPLSSCPAALNTWEEREGKKRIHQRRQGRDCFIHSTTVCGHQAVSDTGRGAGIQRFHFCIIRSEIINMGHLFLSVSRRVMHGTSIFPSPGIPNSLQQVHANTRVPGHLEVRRARMPKAPPSGPPEAHEAMNTHHLYHTPPQPNPREGNSLCSDHRLRQRTCPARLPAVLLKPAAFPENHPATVSAEGALGSK